jgi:hypothetical protein
MRTSKIVPAIRINSIADENLRNRAAVAGIAIVDKPFGGQSHWPPFAKISRDKVSLRKRGLIFPARSDPAMSEQDAIGQPCPTIYRYRR